MNSISLFKSLITHSAVHLCNFVLDGPNLFSTKSYNLSPLHSQNNDLSHLSELPTVCLKSFVQIIGLVQRLATFSLKDRLKPNTTLDEPHLQKANIISNEKKIM